MSNSVPTTATTGQQHQRLKKTSTKVRLLQAAAFAAVLVPLGTVAVETSSITCGFNGGSANFCAGSGANQRVFDFRPLGSGYKVVLEFENIHGQFNVSFQDFLTSQSALTSGSGSRLSGFPGHNCVTIHNLVDCVEFRATAPAPSSTTWTGFYNLFIFWDPDTNSAFPNGAGQIRMLHNIGGTSPTYDTDITIAGSYFPGSPTVADPGIGGRDNNFQDFLVTQAPIPEPGTMLLVGSGIGALLYRRRRRRQDSEGPPQS